jgi:hypothetical protein
MSDRFVPPQLKENRQKIGVFGLSRKEVWVISTANREYLGGKYVVNTSPVDFAVNTFLQLLEKAQNMATYVEPMMFFSVNKIAPMRQKT